MCALCSLCLCSRACVWVHACVGGETGPGSDIVVLVLWKSKVCGHPSSPHSTSHCCRQTPCSHLTPWKASSQTALSGATNTFPFHPIMMTPGTAVRGARLGGRGTNQIKNAGVCTVPCSVHHCTRYLSEVVVIKREQLLLVVIGGGPDCVYTPSAIPPPTSEGHQRPVL